MAPAFSTQPADVTATEPAPATFTLAATGEPAPAIQWQLSTDGGTSWADVPGAIGQSHAIDPTGTALNGSRYRAVATNGLGSAVSEVATLTVNAMPAIAAQPTSLAVTAPASASFTAAASGLPAPTMRWQLSTDGGATWADVAGATGATYSIDPTSTALSSSQYRAVATNSAGSATSSAATLTVAAPVGIGPAGGTVTGSDGAQVVIPAGALSGYVGMAITRPGATTPSFPPAGFSAAGVVYEFTPHGATFAVPVTIRVPFDPALVPAGITPKLYRAQPGGSFAEVPGTTVDGNFLVASVSSFSFIGPSYPTPATLAFSEITRQCARESLSGDVWCWGEKGGIATGSGLTQTTQGNGSGTFTEPTRLPPRALTQIVGGSDWVCGLDVLNVWCIGNPYLTREIAGTAPPARQWVKKTLPAGVILTNLVGGGYFACGIGAPNSPDPDAVGRVYCWGDNTRGQLGRSVFETSPARWEIQPVTTTHRYVAVAAGGGFACAALVTGEVECWGSNAYGEIAASALGSFDYSSTPISRGLTVDPRQGALMALRTNACGLKVDGTAFCWGDNFYGQMGNGTAGSGTYATNYRAPSEVPGIKFKSIWPGQTMCGIALDNRAYCWGWAYLGSLGNGSDVSDSTLPNESGIQKTPSPVAMPSGVTFAAMAATDSGICARSTFNEVYCWGDNRYYGLGIGTNTPDHSNMPLKIKSYNLLRMMP